MKDNRTYPTSDGFTGQDPNSNIKVGHRVTNKYASQIKPLGVASLHGDGYCTVNHVRHHYSYTAWTGCLKIA